ncbi:hypothetical protein ACMHYB_03175 [Sorangium sp. So ce1128]
MICSVQMPAERGRDKLADDLRTGAIERRVFKDVGQYSRLREPSRTHTRIIRDVVRIKHGLESL